MISFRLFALLYEDPNEAKNQFFNHHEHTPSKKRGANKDQWAGSELEGLRQQFSSARSRVFAINLQMHENPGQIKKKFNDPKIQPTGLHGPKSCDHQDVGNPVWGSAILNDASLSSIYNEGKEPSWKWSGIKTTAGSHSPVRDPVQQISSSLIGWRNSNRKLPFPMRRIFEAVSLPGEHFIAPY